MILPKFIWPKQPIAKVWITLDVFTPDGKRAVVIRQGRPK